MTENEFENWKSQIVISNSEKMGLRKPPRVFIEQGVAIVIYIIVFSQFTILYIDIRIGSHSVDFLK